MTALCAWFVSNSTGLIWYIVVSLRGTIGYNSCVLKERERISSTRCTQFIFLSRWELVFRPKNDLPSLSPCIHIYWYIVPFNTRNWFRSTSVAAHFRNGIFTSEDRCDIQMHPHVYHTISRQCCGHTNSMSTVTDITTVQCMRVNTQ